MNPKYPVYVISKGRWESRLTVKQLEARGIPYHVVIEPQEYDNYAAVIKPENIHVLPFSNLGQGSIPTRNWVWEHSMSIGAERHWILDDNLYSFHYMNKNTKYYTEDGTAFRVIEDWADRFENVALAGMQYQDLVVGTAKHRPIILNTRIYSCILIKNDIPFRWRGRYNEDTDLSLRALKAKYCTALFVAFLVGKATTMKMKGGNTDELYKQNAEFDGRLAMAQSLKEQHPDVTEIVWKWNRWQHQVNYKPFKGNKFRLKKGVQIPEGVNNYGLKFKHKGIPIAELNNNGSN